MSNCSSYQMRDLAFSREGGNSNIGGRGEIQITDVGKVLSISQI